ncbi:glycine-rich cell wall structural protein [Drosophila teissieri]|uniref:glycine-rich cell wall structural protein n=1 Tax=Drosophila teissieri TaxID=7243 RepID=UPI001CBA4D80|nr:glycine-rich cell wall structural protein [Drosophila teissieri]
MLRIRSVSHVQLAIVLVASVLVTAKQETSTRQFGGQNFGNGLGPSFGGVGVGGLGPGAGAGFGPGAGSGAGYPGQGGYGPPQQPGCPLCDSSVYSYCSHKMVHDACCCDFPGGAPQLRPPQCLYYDCSLLYAKSCYEHALIKNCCCNNPY